MANKKLIDNLDSAIAVEGTPVVMDGGRVVIHITATDYGTDGQVAIKGSADGIIFTTLKDSTTITELAEYTANVIINIDKLGQGWQIRADFEGITGGTSTALNVTMGTN